MFITYRWRRVQPTPGPIASRVSTQHTSLPGHNSWTRSTRASPAALCPRPMSAETRRTRRTGPCGTGPADGRLSEELTVTPCVMRRWLAGNLSQIQPTIEPSGMRWLSHLHGRPLAGGGGRSGDRALSHAGQIVLGVPLALAAAAGFGACSLLQFRANRQVPEAPVGRFTLLMWLVRRPAWRWSVMLAAVAFGLQVAALSLAPLIGVQPLLVTGLLWYVLLFAMVERVRPDRQVMLESTLCLVGLSTFLVIARPATGPGSDLELAPAGLLLGAT